MVLEFSINPFKIQKRILKILNQVHGKEKELSKRLQDEGVSQSQLDKLVEKETKSLNEEKEILESQKQFAYQFWMTLANIIVVIISTMSFLVTLWLSVKTVKKLNEPNQITKQQLPVF